jgi:hypothetical protein
MAVRTDFQPGEVLLSADMNDTFGSKLNIAGGKILQIVRATDTTQRDTTSTSFVDVTGMSVTITPQKNDSAIVLMVFAVPSILYTTTTGNNSGRLQITDASNNAISGAQDNIFGLANITRSTDTAAALSPVVITGYATPATINATTYKLRFRSNEAATTFRLRNNEATGQFFAIEVSA